METIVKDADTIVSLFKPSTSGKNFIQIVGNTMFMVSPELFDKCRKDELESVTFANAGLLPELAGKEPMTSYQVSSFKRSELVTLTRSTALDMAKLDSEFKVKIARANYTNKLSELGKELV